jgi:hypothetical protein
MKNEILNKGLEKTIEKNNRFNNNIVQFMFGMLLATTLCIVLLVHRTKKVEALEYQIEQRDAKIANLEATNNELLFDLKQKYFNDGK